MIKSHFKKRGEKRMKLAILLLLAVCYLILFSYSVFAQSPHNVQGFVFYNNGTAVENNISVRIIDLNNSEVVDVLVDAPPFPGFKGAYVGTINSSDNDSIVVRAWNSSNYGETNATLLNTTTYVNITLNLTRPSETNVTILAPLNDSLFNVSAITQINATVGIIGGQDGTNCFAQLNISDTSILNETDGNYTQRLGNINLGDSVNVTWNVSGLSEGAINFSVVAFCGSDGINFERLNNRTISNITLEDISPPVVTLISPPNASSLSYTGTPTTFTYNVTDESTIQNCSLYINNELNQTNTTITRNIPQSFSETLSIGNYTWFVSCIDTSNLALMGNSTVFNLSIVANAAPVVSDMVVDNPIDLVINGTRIVFCNASVYDPDNVSDIVSVNATFFHSSVTNNATDDNNNHYSNNSCRIVDDGEFDRNYSCSFPVQYYANSGNWTCNISAYDTNSGVGSSNISTIINELLAIDVSHSLIDYGTLSIGNISSEDINVTVANLGNMDFNLTLEGFGITPGDNLSMDCYLNNISAGFQRYSTRFNQTFGTMTNVTSTLTQVVNFTLPQRTNDAASENDINTTYWKLQVPQGVNGRCNGTLNFVALLT